MDDDVAVIALGANENSAVGTPLQTLRLAIDRLADLTAQPVRYSSPYLGPAVDCDAGAADFINAIALLKPAEHFTPYSLLQSLLQLEAEFGRTRGKGSNESRPMDLDLVCFGDRMLDSAGLVLPHPRATQRAFVLTPLAELDPGFIIPGSAVSVQELLAELPQAGGALQRLSWDEV